MATIELNPDFLRRLRVDIDKAVASVAKAHGLTSLTTGKCNFDPHAGNFTFELQGIASGGKDKSATAYEDLRASHVQLGLPELPELFKAFTFDGKSYAIVGANRTRSKVLAKQAQNGKTYLFKPEFVASLTATNNKKSRRQAG